MTSTAISEQQARILIEGLDKRAYVFGPNELERLRRLHHRGLVRILASGRATASYDTTEEGRTYLKINSAGR